MSTTVRRIIPGSGGLYTNLPFTPNALEVLSKRYLKKDPDGAHVTENGKEYHKVVESPEEMFHRIARALANVELRYGKTQEQAGEYQQKFFDIMEKFEFTPAGRTLANAGLRDVINNCLVLHIDDDMKSIGDTMSEAMQLQQLGVGLGFPWDTLRPAGFFCKKSQGVASGPCSFLDVYNRAFGVIQQQNRHGANMGTMAVEYPDVLEFLHVKDREGTISNFNISVKFSDDFMQKVESRSSEQWMCNFKGQSMKPRRIKRNDRWHYLGAEEVDMTAYELMQEAADGGWRTGEPGYIFIDEVNRTNTLPGLGPILSSNPCGEQFLHDGDVCNLGAINLEPFVTEDGRFKWERLDYVTDLAVRMLDNVIDISKYPVERVESTSKRNRRVGLGIMGFADALYKLKVGYDTDEGRRWAKDIMKRIDDQAWKTSFEIAREKGPFPNVHLSIWANSDEKPRNAAVTNVPPTGTIAMMLDVSSGIEPYFALAYYYHNVLGGNTDLYYMNKHLRKALEDEGVTDIDRIVKEIERKGSLQKIDGVPESIKRVFVTSMDISPEAHVRMQAAFQEHCTNAISKTINFPESATREEILESMILAWKLRCKGITVYRNNSRQVQVINLNDGKKEKAKIDHSDDDCPSCRAKLKRSDGCISCTECDYGRCSL